MTLTHEINSVLLEAAVARCVPTVQADKDSRVHALACNAEHTLTQALRHVGPGDTLLASGICTQCEYDVVESQGTYSRPFLDRLLRFYQGIDRKEQGG